LAIEQFILFLKPIYLPLQVVDTLFESGYLYILCTLTLPSKWLSKRWWLGRYRTQTTDLFR